MIEISKKITTNVGRTNAQFGLIKENDRIMIGFSGGKDSLTLIHTLNRMKKKAPFKFDFKELIILFIFFKNEKRVFIHNST